MKIIFRIFLFFPLLFACAGTYAQSSTIDPDHVYGLDPLLYNGKIYNFVTPAAIDGTPYFDGADFVKGSVKLRGVTYDNLLLKYDVFHQQLILQYKTSLGADNQIVISDAWLEAFNMGGHHFEMLAIQDTLKGIYEVMGTGTYRILYSWRKELLLESYLGATYRLFSVSKKETYLLAGTKLSKYNNNRHFTTLFGPSQQVILKKYLRQQKINVKKASDQAITELINYCNTISTQ